MERSEILEIVNVALEKIRPYLQADGGDIILKNISEDLVVTVESTGACDQCPYSEFTLKAGVEESIRKVLPELRGVVAINNMK